MQKPDREFSFFFFSLVSNLLSLSVSTSSLRPITVEVTYIDVSLLVAQEEVVHDGSVVEVLQRGHVLHASDAAVVHGLHLLPGEGVLLVGVNLQHNMGDVIIELNRADDS